MTNTLKGLPPITFFLMHDLMQTMVQNIGLEIYISERHICVVSASESKKTNSYKHFCAACACVAI